MQDDDGAITTVLEKVRLGLKGKLKSGSLWAAVATLASGILYVAKEQIKIDQHQESITSLQQERRQDHELLQKMSTQLEVVISQMSNLTAESNRQRDWRERIEDVAELPPHPRKHK